MKFKEKMIRLALILVSIGLYSASAHADHSVRVGNAVLKPGALEKIIRGVIVSTLGGDLSRDQLTLRIDRFEQSLVVASPKPALKEILDILGLKNRLAVTVAPIQAHFTLPESALKIQIKNTSENSFLINAQWSITQLRASTSTVSIKVPAGFFPQAFTINSSPIQIALAPRSRAVEFASTFSAELSEEGTKIRLLDFKTNLETANHPNFAITMGKLTVNGRPFTLEIQSNGQTLTASESHIRAQFQTLEKSLAGTIRINLADLVRKQTRIQAHAIESQAPFKYSANSSEWLEKLTMRDSVRTLLGGVNFDFLFTYLQAVKTVGAYSAQIAAKICLDGQCLSDYGDASPIGADDLALMQKNDDIGAIVYESMIQTLVHSDPFQKRISAFYASAGASPGVTLAPAGVKVYLDPHKNALVAVINLEIDIKKTFKEGTPFGRRLQRRIGDIWELWFGSGKVVKIPVEVDFIISGLVQDREGKPIIMLTTELPVQADGAI
ncbi:MAG: hypothetical protein H7333_07485 [Bdellovibrionales bacterium]|nr:hypothetical protein [Oligoflexia bacterium]